MEVGLLVFQFHKVNNNYQEFQDKVMEQAMILLYNNHKIIKILKVQDSQIISRKVKTEQAMEFNQEV
jgi:hypothetical protein